MPANTLAELITDTLQGLGFPPKEYAEVEDAARAVVHASALVKQVTGFSSQNLNFKHIPLRPASRDVSLASAGDIAVPAWVERRMNLTLTLSQDSWDYVRVCNLSELEDARLRGVARCAFYVENEQLRVRFSYEPESGEHRLWYSPESWIGTTLDDVVAGVSTTPSGFWPLIVGLAQLILIPSMRIRAAMDTQTPANKQLIEAWDKMEVTLVALVGPLPTWADRLKHLAHSERGGSHGRRRRPVLSRAREF